MPTPAQQVMIDALRLAIDADRAGRFAEIGAGYDEVERRGDCDPVAVVFLESWQDAANHQWLYYPGMNRDDWLRTAECIIDDLRSGPTIRDPRVLKRFAQPHVTLRRFAAALSESGVTCSTCGYQAPEGTRCPECGCMVVNLRLFRRLRRWRAAAGVLLCLPFVVQGVAFAFDRSDFGFPGKPPWGALCGFSWLLSPLFALPIAACWSAFRYGRVRLASVVAWIVLYGVGVVGFGMSLWVVLGVLEHWL